MITIMQGSKTGPGNGYTVELSEPGTRGTNVKANDLAEAKQVVDHYYGGGHGLKPRRSKCPLCRLLMPRSA